MSYKNNSIPKHILGNSNILPQAKANQSQFNLSEDLKTTIKFDSLYPVYWEELNPGDRFEVKTQTLARLMPMVAPTMSNIRLKYFSFFVPNRLLWKNWTKFMGEKIYQDDSVSYTLPSLGFNAVTPGSLADYMGMPIFTLTNDKVMPVTALPFRAYNKIWNEWFRANELQPPVKEFSGDFPTKEEMDSYLIQKKGKPHDYFTSCLPYPQSGEPVVIPVAGETPIRTLDSQTRLQVTDSTGKLVTGVSKIDPSTDHIYMEHDSIVPGGKGFATGLYTDMSEVTGISIEMLRKASALQVLLEKDARAGESYIDLMNVHYGTSVPDFLVGRSQYLGSSTTMINVEPIAQTNGTTNETPQGNLAGVGIGVNGDELCEISAVEHGIFIILACVEGDVSYSQGIPRKFSKDSRYDYMFPEFHNLGDQSVLNKEIFVSDDLVLNEQVFGYQERYRELRESTNKVSGLMRSNIPGSLDVWHLGQKFDNLPTLSGDFIESHTPIDRALAVPSEDHLILNIYFDVKATRTLPVSSNPSLLAGRV